MDWRDNVDQTAKSVSWSKQCWGSVWVFTDARTILEEVRTHVRLRTPRTLRVVGLLIVGTGRTIEVLRARDPKPLVLGRSFEAVVTLWTQVVELPGRRGTVVTPETSMTPGRGLECIGVADETLRTRIGLRQRSHRLERTDAARRTGFAERLIADPILGGPGTWRTHLARDGVLE